jgi:hypothetical protein
MLSPTAIDVSGNIGINEDSILVVTSFSEVAQRPSIGFRIFHDMRGNVEYRRISDSAITTLTEAFTNESTYIAVADASRLGQPNINRNIPGVVFISGERIAYYSIDYEENKLLQIRRGAGGTAIFDHEVGEYVQGADLAQEIPNAHIATWYNTGIGSPTDGRGLQNSTTPQAKFLLLEQVTPPFGR